MLVKLKALSPFASLPLRATPKSYGYDLATFQPETIAGGETRVVFTGWALAGNLPFNEGAAPDFLSDLQGAQGLAMLVLPRSSLALKHGLLVANSPGLIDADYTGQLGVVLHNLRDVPVELAAYERIAQLVFVRVELPMLWEVSEPRDPTQPEWEVWQRGGFGSTGSHPLAEPGSPANVESHQ